MIKIMPFKLVLNECSVQLSVLAMILNIIKDDYISSRLLSTQSRSEMMTLCVSISFCSSLAALSGPWRHTFYTFVPGTLNSYTVKINK